MIRTGLVSFGFVLLAAGIAACAVLLAKVSEGDGFPFRIPEDWS